MRTAKLNIWITEVDNPCRISKEEWYISIYNCDGRPLTWCGSPEKSGIGGGSWTPGMGSGAGSGTGATSESVIVPKYLALKTHLRTSRGRGPARLLQNHRKTSY